MKLSIGKSITTPMIESLSANVLMHRRLLTLMGVKTKLTFPMPHDPPKLAKITAEIYPINTKIGSHDR